MDEIIKDMNEFINLVFINEKKDNATKFSIFTIKQTLKSLLEESFDLGVNKK